MTRESSQTCGRNALVRAKVAAYSLATVPRRTVGVSLVRIGSSVGIVHFYLSSYDHRRLLWGPHGLLASAPWASGNGLLGTISPYRLWSGEMRFEVAFHGAIALALAFGLLGGRFLAGMNWLLLQSIQSRNPLILDGGDNLLRILILLLLLTESNLYWAVGASRRRARWNQRMEGEEVSLRVFLHNCGAVLIVFQALALYGAATLWKLSGEPWRDGTALYYVSQASEFAFRPLPHIIVFNPLLVTLLTYSVLLAQISLVILAILRRWPYVVLATAFSLHAGIALSMGLVTFSMIILSVDAALISDVAWFRLRQLLIERQVSVPGTLSLSRKKIEPEPVAQVAIMSGEEVFSPE